MTMSVAGVYSCCARWTALGRVGWWAGLLLLAVGGGPLGAAELTPEEEGARLVLNRWVQAIGGLDQLVHRKFADYACQISFGPKQAPIPAYIRATADGRYRYEYTLPTYGLLVQAFDGNSAWQINETLGFGPLSASEHYENLAGADFREPVRIVGRYPHIKQLPDATIDGRKLQVVEMGTQEGWLSKWYFEPETGLRVRIEAVIGTQLMVIEFSDFREFQNVREPYRIVRKMGGATLEIVRKSILYNEPTEPMLFAPPPSLIGENNEMEKILRSNDEVMGNRALQEVNTQVIKSVTVNLSSGVRMTSTTYKKRPNLMVRQIETPGLGVEWSGFDGKTGWVSSELQGFRTMQGAELQQTMAEANMDEPLRLRRMSTLRRSLGQIQEPDRLLAGIAMATAGGPVGNFYYDTSTLMLARLETYMQAGPTGVLKVVADFSDYRRVGGVKVAFHIVVINPAMRLDTKIESVEQNVSLDDALFQPKKDL